MCQHTHPHPPHSQEHLSPCQLECLCYPATVRHVASHSANAAIHALTQSPHLYPHIVQAHCTNIHVRVVHNQGRITHANKDRQLRVDQPFAENINPHRRCPCPYPPYVICYPLKFSVSRHANKLSPPSLHTPVPVSITSSVPTPMSTSTTDHVQPGANEYAPLPLPQCFHMRVVCATPLVTVVRVVSTTHPRHTHCTRWATCHILWYGAGAENQVELFDEDQAIEKKFTYNLGRDDEQQRVVFFDHFDCERVSYAYLRWGGDVRREDGCEHLRAMTTIKIIINDNVTKRTFARAPKTRPLGP